LSNHCGMYITLLYLFVKLLNIINVFSQLAILNGFLGPEYTWWGVEILNDLLNGRQWEDSGHFPRVTMCDVTIRAFGNIQTWSVQCVLVMNMFNEKIFLFLWWWFCLVGVLTTLNFLYWLTISVCSSSSYSFIRLVFRVEG
uniref:Innexin n=1 Tax=Plectus sambesii TaxID=2011161 RepID=A0A914VH76_9BILA